MEQNKYLTLHSIVRMLAALLALVAFIMMFVADQAYIGDAKYGGMKFAEAFFGTNAVINNSILGFIGYILVILGGLAGLSLCFVDELIGDKQTVKMISFICGGAILLGTLFIFLIGVCLRGANSDGIGINNLKLAAGAIVAGCFAAVAGLCNVAAPILEDKGL